jgi:hypothetical protein
MKEPLVTIVEHLHYLARAKKLLSQEQIDNVAEILAVNPKAGDVMPGTGGCRKMRYAGLSGKGKSGGMRVIHFFVDADQEVHLLDIYGKNEKSNLSGVEKKQLLKLTALLKGE